MTYHELINNPKHYEHHAATKRGYVSRKASAPIPIMEYEGRFGKGYIVLFPRFDTHNYCTAVYYIERKTP